MTKLSDNKGLTLMEVLITMVIAGVIFAVAISLQFFGVRSYTLGITQAEIQQDARLADEVIRKQLRNATYLNLTPPPPPENGTIIIMRLTFADNKITYGEIGATKTSLKIPGVQSIFLDNTSGEGNILNIRIEGREHDYVFSNRIILNNFNYSGAEIGSINDLQLGDSDTNSIYYKLP